jgi:excisionase family DNA binding protein
MSIGVTEAAKKLGVTNRRVRVLCSQGRIKGAEFVGTAWNIPNDPVVIPAGRTRPGKIQIEAGKDGE